VSGLNYAIPEPLRAPVESALREWTASDRVGRIWARDASVWTGSDEANWLGWLTIAGEQLAHRERFAQFAAEVRAAGFTYAVLLGMGGSSLCPEVLRLSFGHIAGFPDLHVLDSTDPAQVRAIETKIDLARTLFIVSSKSGSTLEPNIFKQYFFERAGRNGAQFVAITDPGSHMQQVAEQDKFWKICFGVPSIGGRFSALSDFGMIPAAAMGIDTARLLERARQTAEACSANENNPGLQLGVLLGTLARHGRDKVTIAASPAIHDLGAWLEQLIAESTGKDGKALIPVDREPLGPPAVYGDDRLFVYERLETGADPVQDRAIEALEAAGHAVIRIPVSDVYGLGAEFFRWEFATAVAGAILGINPFNQPDVEASKAATRKLTAEYEATGSLPAEKPAFSENGITVFAAAPGAAAAAGATTLEQALRAHLETVRAGDYFALLAYIEMTVEHEAALTRMRVAIRNRKRVATCVGFGPRFLHSTGQAYKGGPNTGVFLQITASDAQDLAIPGQKYTFGVVKAAQARGDFDVLAERGRRALRVHLGTDVAGGLHKLAAALERALA
jgi:transaldolase/glucose-6-phosphate isomerase